MLTDHLDSLGKAKANQLGSRMQKLMSSHQKARACINETNLRRLQNGGELLKGKDGGRIKSTFKTQLDQKQ
jgi:hypothetical protein